MESSGIMLTERAAAARIVDTAALQAIFYGSNDTVAKRQYLARLYYEDEVIKSLGSKEGIAFLSRQALYERAMRICQRLQEIRYKHGLTSDDFMLLKELAFEETPLLIHDSVYMTSLSSQAGEGQRNLVDRAAVWADVGCYAQTELTHGSSIRDLQTTATYIPESDEFEINSNGVTGMKWWVGALGKTATHAVVMAQLILDNKNMGLHPFHLRIRDETTHELLPGIECADIGPKLGFAPIDNGCARFRRLRVPRTSLLSKMAKLQRNSDGSVVYIAPKHPQAAYKGMLLARVFIVQYASSVLAHATTISTRYSICRKQFKTATTSTKSENSHKLSPQSDSNAGTPAAEETQILDYFSQQARIFPYIASAYMLKALERHLQQRIQTAEREFDTGNMSSLSSLHSFSSALKVFVTEHVTSGVEECRRSCGGHGYSQISALPRILNSQTHVITAEGDNWVLCQQTAKALLKDPSQGMASLPELPDASSGFDCAHGKTARQIYSWLQSCLQTKVMALQLEAQGLAPEDQASWWNLHMPDFFALANLYGACICLGVFTQSHASLTASGVKGGETRAIGALCDCFASHVMIQMAGSLFDSGVVEHEQMLQRSKFLSDACIELRPLAVALTDAFGLRDEALGTPMGAFGGVDYDRFVEWVEAEPLNRGTNAAAAEAVKHIRHIGELLHKAKDVPSLPLAKL